MFGVTHLPEGTKEQSLEQAKKFVEEKKFDEALKIYNALHELTPKNIVILEARAKLHALTKNKTKLAEDLAKISALKFPGKKAIVSEKKDDVQSRLLKVREALKSKIEEELIAADKILIQIIEEVEHSVKSNPSMVHDENYRKKISGYNYCHGQIKFLLGKQEEARVAFLLALFFDNNDILNNEVLPENLVEPNDRLYAVNFFAKHNDNEEKEVQKDTTAIRQKQNERHFKNYLNRAHIYRKHKLYAKALSDLSVAKWLNDIYEQPEGVVSSSIFHALAREIFVEMGLLEHAIKMHEELIRFENVIRKNDKRKWTKTEEVRNHEFIINIIDHVKKFQRQKKYQVAIDFLQHAISLEPKNIDLYTRLAQTFALNQQLEEEAATQEKIRLLRRAINPQQTEILESPKTSPDSSNNQHKPVSAPNPQPKFKTRPRKYKKTADEIAAERKLRAERDEKIKLDEQIKGIGPSFFKDLAAQNAKAKDLKRQQKRAAKPKKIKTTFSRRKAKQVFEESKKQQEQEFKVTQEKEMKDAIEKAEKRVAEEKARREAAFAELKREEQRRLEFSKKQDEAFQQRRSAKLAEEKEKQIFSDLSDYKLDLRVAINEFERTLIDALEDGNESVISLVFGGTARSRVAKKISASLNDPEADLDILTTANPEQILKSLAKFGIKKSKKPGQFEIQTFDENNKKMNIQIRATPHKKFKEHRDNLDFTINEFAFDKYGYVYGTQRGLDDLKAKRLDTIVKPELSFAEDSSRTLRGGDFIKRFGLTTSDELMNQLEIFATDIPVKAESHRIHTWMMQKFSSRFVSPEQSIANFNFLCQERLTPSGKKWNYLSKLFSSEAADSMLKAATWIFSELRKGPVTQKEIYMIFYVSLVKQKPYDPINTKKEIYDACPLLADKLSGATNFGYLFNKYCSSWDRAHSPPILQQAVVPKVAMFYPGLSMFRYGIGPNALGDMGQLKMGAVVSKA